MKKRAIFILVTALSLTLSACGLKQNTPGVAEADAAAQIAPQMEYAFTKDNQHPEKLLVGVINGTKSTLDIAIYSLTNKDIVSAILDAKKRGVEVRVITDKQEASTKAQSESLKQLKTAGIPIKENSHKGLMHLKVTVADKSVFTTGSFNYSAAAATINDEVLVVVHDVKTAQEWSAEFDKMWNDKANFQDVK